MRAAAVVDDEPEPLLRVDDVCKRLMCTRPTVRKLMRTSALRYVRVGRHLRFKREWVEDFIEHTGTAQDPARKGRRRTS